MKYKEKYTKNCMPALKEEFKFENIHEIPKVVKVVLNTSDKEAAQDPKIFDSIAKDLSAIAGQKSVITKAKKAIANFKLRAGMPIGCKVTLRGDRMYEFMNRLTNVALPRVRDFKGVSKKGFDGRGNYTMGINEHIIFPEINIDKTNKVFGMNITFVTTAKNDKEGKALLEKMGIPFRR